MPPSSSSRKGHVLSLDAAVDILATNFEDPWKSTVCASRLHLAADRIEKELLQRQRSEQIKFAKSQPIAKLLRSGIRLLTRKYSRPEYVAMVAHMLTCRCNWSDPKIQELHAPGSHPPCGLVSMDDMFSLRAVMRTVVDCISFALSGMTKGKFRNLEDSSAQDSPIKPWPYDLDDLLPTGHDAELMTTLTRWEAQAGGYIIFRLANAIAKFYPPFLQTLIQDPDLEFVLRRPMIEITSTCDWYERDPNAAKQPTPNETSDITAPLNVIFELLFQVYPTLEFQLGLPAQRSTVVPVIERLRRLLPLFPAPVSWSSNVKVACEKLLSTAKGEEEGLDERCDALAHHDPVNEAFSELVSTRKSAGCLNINCPRGPEAYARVCSKCDVVRFCGAECQKEAWRSEMFPHKRLCKRIFALREQLGSDAWPKLFTDGASMKAFSECLEDKEINMESLELIEGELLMLKTMRHDLTMVEAFKKATGAP